MRRLAFGGAAICLITTAVLTAARRSPAQSPLTQSTLAPTVHRHPDNFQAEIAAAVWPDRFAQTTLREPGESKPSRALESAETAHPGAPPEELVDSPVTPTPVRNPHVSTLTDRPGDVAESTPQQRASKPDAGPSLMLQHPTGSWHATRPSEPSASTEGKEEEQLRWRPRRLAEASSSERDAAKREAPREELDAREAANTIGGGDSNRRSKQYVARQQLPTQRLKPEPLSTAPRSPSRLAEPRETPRSPEGPHSPATDETSSQVEQDSIDAQEPVVIEDRREDDQSRDGARRQSTTPTKDDSSSQPARRSRKAAANLPPLTRQQINLRNKIRRVLKHYYDRPLNTGNRGPWELMHAMLSFEVHSRVLQGGPNGDPITTVGWLCFNQPCRNRTLLYLNNDGDLRVRVGPALQGHQGQLLALLALSRVKSDYPIRVEGKEFTIEDLVETEKLTCYPKTELTFKLIGLQNYLEPEATWVNDQGMTWDFERLVAEELRQPVRGAACGGTHRLTGLALGVKTRRKEGLPLTATFTKAERFVGQYMNYAYRLQNSDGSFSTEWFRGPGKESDLDRRLKTTGHTLEWLLYSGNEQQLNYYRTVRAVNYLANLMWSNRFRDWEAGPLGHAIHALVLYDRLVFAKYDEGEHPIAVRAAESRR